MNENFGIFVDEAYQNEEILNYMNRLRREDPHDEIFVGFERWAKKNIEDSKRKFQK